MCVQFWMPSEISLGPFPVCLLLMVIPSPSLHRGFYKIHVGLHITLQSSCPASAGLLNRMWWCNLKASFKLRVPPNSPVKDRLEGLSWAWDTMNSSALDRGSLFCWTGVERERERIIQVPRYETHYYGNVSKI
jgi:hypothetical protein